MAGQDNKQGMIDALTGEVIIPVVYDEVTADCDCLWVRKGELQLPFAVTLFDKLERSIIHFGKDGKHGIYDRENKKIILPCVYEDILWAGKDAVACRKEGKYGIIRLSTKEVLVPFVYDSMIQYYYFFPE